MIHNRTFRLTAPEPYRRLAQELLAAQGFVSEPEPFSPLARRLVHGPFPLGRSLAAFFGHVYIQDRSSMLPALALAPPSGAEVLDMCASPGSKTGLLAQLIGAEGLVLGNEPDPSRLATLRRNLQAANALHAVTCCWAGETLPLPDAGWDHILLDPPCSGWGTTDRHPNVRKIWHGANIRPLIRLQRALLREAMRLLRPGGRLIYATCTSNVDENEAQARFARDELGLLPLPLARPPGFAWHEPALPDVSGTLRVDENASRAQGFFLAGFTGTSRNALPESPPGRLPAWTPLAEEELERAGVRGTLPPGQAGVFGRNVYMLPARALNRLPVRLRWQGLTLGAYAGGTFHPSGRLRPAAYEGEPPRADIDDIKSLCALIQGQSLPLGLPGRMARLFWRGLPLGLLRLKSGRAMWSER
jgi:16S rRNA (cytosine1407-C5)-methyltransferase